MGGLRATAYLGLYRLELERTTLWGQSDDALGRYRTLPSHGCFEFIESR